MPHRQDGIQRPLRIGLNLLFLGERAGGIGRYAIELPGALLAVEPASELHLFVSRALPPQLRLLEWASEVRWHIVPVGVHGPRLHLPAQFLALPVMARRARLDVLHSPANTGPVLTPGLASVITLQDLIWLHRPHEWEASRRAHVGMRALVGHCTKHATRIFATTNSAAEDFTATLGIPRQRIELTPLGVAVPAERAAVPEERLRASLELADARVVLCVAQKRPYKNLQSLVRALPQLEPDVVLVLPGSATEHERELRALAQELGVGERVRFPDWLDDDELDRLYRLASVFALPSLIEGFGLPVLEAMARGTPVACSDRPALPEVAGGAALLFDPERQEEVTAAVRRLLDDGELRRQLVARGRERAAFFSWKRTGESSLAGYRSALAAQGRGVAHAVSEGG